MKIIYKSPLQQTKKIFKPTISSTALAALCSLYFGSVLNLSLWHYIYLHLEISNVSIFLFALSVPVFLFIVHYLIFTIVLWPYIFKPIVVLLLIVSSAANYLMFKFGIFIDADMMRNVFETTTREASDMVTLTGLIWLTITGLLPAVILIRTKIRYKKLVRELLFRLVTIILGLILLGLIGAATYKEYVSFGHNTQVRRLINPSNYIYATVHYFQQQSLATRKFEILDANAVHAPFKDPQYTVFIIVLGEAARAQNFSLNGYKRQTNPLLSQEDILYFKNVTSCGTATAISVPCIFSSASRSNFDVVDAKFTENLMDLLQSSGYEVWWRDNDDGCKGVCDRVPTENIDPKGQPKFCNGTSCLDAVLLEGLEDYLKNIKKDTVIVLHTRGSHGPSYFERYPEEFKMFTPTCDTADLQNCSQEAIINTYDNTLLYTDYIVASAINILKKFDQIESGLLYVSDHGQSLGENNIYLHGLPYAIAPDTQTKVPMLLWLSANMRQYDHLDYPCLQDEASNKGLSHDNLFHSLLGLLEIDSKLYQKELDFFAPCRTKELPIIEPMRRQ